MDPHDARTALDQIRAGEEQVIAEVRRWPRPWYVVSFAIAVGALMATGDFVDRPVLFWPILGAGTLAVAALSVGTAVRYLRNPVMVHRSRYSPWTFWVWLGVTAVMIAIGIGGPPALSALGVPLPRTAAGLAMACALSASMIVMNRVVGPSVPRSDP